MRSHIEINSNLQQFMNLVKVDDDLRKKEIKEVLKQRYNDLQE